MTPEESNHESTGQRVFNLFVLQPAGWLTTAIEDLPGLVTKGRDCVSPHLRTAHAVGHLTVAFGAKEMGRKANQFLHRSDEPRTSSTRTRSHPPATHGEAGLRPTTRTAGRGPLPSEPASEDGPDGGPSTRAEDARVVPIAPTSAAGAPTGGAEPATTKAASSKAASSKAATSKAATSKAETSKPATSSRPRTPRAAVGKRATVDLAIPGYDTLSASQVVRRLDGLGEAELEAVRRYESGSRGRRTILNRIAQIRGEPRDQGETRTAPEPPGPEGTGAGDERLE